MEWKIIGTSLTVAVVLIWAVAWLIKAILKYFLDKDIEAFKEGLKTEAFKQQTVFASLHEKRASVIEILYERLARTDDAIVAYIAEFVPAGALSEEERRGRAIDYFNDFARYFSEKEIYFDERTCTRLKSYIKDNKEVLQRFMLRELYKDEKKKREEWGKVAEKHRTTIQETKGELKNIFRKFLGVENTINGTWSAPICCTTS